VLALLGLEGLLRIDLGTAHPRLWKSHLMGCTAEPVSLAMGSSPCCQQFLQYFTGPRCLDVDFFRILHRLCVLLDLCCSHSGLELRLELRHLVCSLHDSRGEPSQERLKRCSTRVRILFCLFHRLYAVALIV
jgi:hypothetical protein